MTRLPKHKLPKEAPKKCAQTIKHKRSAKALAKKEKKLAKANEMETESVVSSATQPKYANDEEREAARLERKKANAHRNMYKKTITSYTARNGPRAING